MLAIFRKSIVILRVRVSAFSLLQIFRIITLKKSKFGNEMTDYSARANLTSTIV